MLGAQTAASLITIMFALLLVPVDPVKAQTQSTTAFSRTETPFSLDFGSGEQQQQQKQKLLFRLDDFAHALRIEKDQQDPSRLLNVFLPQPNSGHFRQFIARVVDISLVEDSRSRDANRTFLASLADSSVINVHGLSPGHKYQIAILGRREAESTLIREDQVLMDPVPLDFGVPGNSSSILATHNNITMRAHKHDRALQDTFRVEYRQMDPLKRFPILDVHDIQEQRDVELYLGNLSPGRDYAISVTSLREELPSQPWRGVVTTRPLRPVNLSLSEHNSSCVLLQWLLPAESGADRFKVAYGMLHGPNSMLKFETDYPIQQMELCRQIVPGRVFIFAVIAEKSRQISEPATISHTVRPLPPRELTVEPDFERAQFRVRVHLATENQSHTEKCQITIQSEQGGKGEQTVVTAQGQTCEALFDLVPGRRYEISATALSGQTASTKVLRNKAVEPGFDFAAFGLTLREGDGGSLRLEWPQSEVARLRIADLWARIVGRDSHLHFSVQPIEGVGNNITQMETGPTEPEPVVVEGVHEGECYKVLLYTVTSSGIVSEQRLEQHIRTNAPRVDLAVGQLDSRSATLRAFLFRARRPPPQSTEALSPTISPHCQLHLLVSDSITSELVLDRTLPLAGQRSPPSLLLEGLKPWHEYLGNAQVNCGAQGIQKCPPKVHKVGLLRFRTEPAPPGPIANLSVKSLNSYSAQIRWLAPREPNGRLTHHILQVEPQPDPDWDAAESPPSSSDDPVMRSRPWTERVDFDQQMAESTAELQPDGSESLLPKGPLAVEKVLDGLAGGRRYRLIVWAVNEAGQGKGSEPIWLDMPISAPPRPTRGPDILADSVRSRQMTIRIDASKLSERNGPLMKMAVIVAEMEETGGNLSDGQREEWITGKDDNKENGTLPTWAMARRLPGRWPPFVAMELWPPAAGRKDGRGGVGRRFGSRLFTETIGAEEECGQAQQQNRETATAICNGPLKPNAIYRVKLRVYSAPHLFTDSPYSDPVHMDPLVDQSSYGHLLLLLLFAVLLISVGSVLFYARRRHRHGHKTSSFCHGKFLHHNDLPDTHDHQGQQRSRESQWQTLKMMMAERAADCLAKLGLDSATATPEKESPLASNGGGLGTSSSSSTTSPRTGPFPIPGHNNVLCGGNTVGPGNNLFSAPHHRRSKSLRERTGVDQRLERLPSGPPPGQRPTILPWTVLKGTHPAERSRPVQICDFLEHVRLMSADSDFRFSEEYEDLKTIGLGQSCIAADLTENRAKNRFTNILPYDHSRVKLRPTDDEDGSDYVNASYIPGFNSRREFIAAQGPLPSTRDHFWRLVWEQQVPAIVALTKCVEKGRDKCHQYWPDNSQRSVLYADIEVTLVTESIDYEEFTIRELRLTNLAEPGQSPRTVQHLHYQAWPDFGVPEHSAGIVHFARLFRGKLPPSPNNKPTIVHCSAGVGRSGTFIALDRLIQHIECGHPLDVFGTVFEMRLERCHMVQNEQQYIFIHKCLQFVLDNFYPFLVSSTASCQSQPIAQSQQRSPVSGNSHLPFGSSISSPITGASTATYGSSMSTRDNPLLLPPASFSQNPFSSSPHQQHLQLMHNSSTGGPPQIEVHHPHQHHHNDGFLEDDEGIAESGV